MSVQQEHASNSNQSCELTALLSDNAVFKNTLKHYTPTTNNATKALSFSFRANLAELAVNHL